MADDEDRPDEEVPSSSGSVSGDGADLVAADFVGQDAAPVATNSGLTPEDIAYMEAVQKKRLKFMIVAGIIIMILGFFAGKHMAESKSDSQAMNIPVYSIVLDVQHMDDQRGYDQRGYGVDTDGVRP